MISTSGSKLIEDETIEVIVKELFHRVTLITPNIDEAAFLSGMQIRNEEWKWPHKSCWSRDAVPY